MRQMAGHICKENTQIDILDIVDYGKSVEPKTKLIVSRYKPTIKLVDPFVDGRDLP